MPEGILWKDQTSRVFTLMKEADVSSGKLSTFNSSGSQTLSVGGIVRGEWVNKKRRKIQ